MRGRISVTAFIVYILVFLMLFVRQFPLNIHLSAPASVNGVEGFLRGFFIFPLWVCELFGVHGITLNQVPNDGRWYDVFYFVGVAVLVAVAGSVVVLPGRRPVRRTIP